MIPRKILERPKMGFGVPMNDWLRRDLQGLMMDTLNKNRDFLGNWFNLEKVDELVKRQQAGEDLARILWPILALSLWAENYL